MRVLLDTHAFLWWITDDPRMPPTARSIIATPDNDVLFSAASAWEIAIKVQTGRLSFGTDPDRLILGQVAANQFTSLPVDTRHALGVLGLPPLHRDPFDRLLIAQAIVEEATLLTADPLVAQYDVPVAW